MVTDEEELFGLEEAELLVEELSDLEEAELLVEELSGLEEAELLMEEFLDSLKMVESDICEILDETDVSGTEELLSISGEGERIAKITDRIKRANAERENHGKTFLETSFVGILFMAATKRTIQSYNHPKPNKPQVNK